MHDRLTRGHSERVRAYTHMVGEELKITGAALDHLRWSALLHDIGKLLVSAEILNKPGKLTDTEFEAIKQHPQFGRELVQPLVGWLGDSARAVWEHHERWDGQGYPSGLSGTDISLAGRIVAVTDAFDVMTSVAVVQGPDLTGRGARRAGALRREPFRRDDRQGVPERVARPVADGDGTVVVADAALVRPPDARDRRRVRSHGRHRRRRPHAPAPSASA